jgi:hypothetical protein
VFVEQLIVLGNVSVVEISNSQIEQDVEKGRKIEKRKIKTVRCISNCVLYSSVHTKNPERLD